jgi:hypothetical protein
MPGFVFQTSPVRNEQNGRNVTAFLPVLYEYGPPRLGSSFSLSHNWLWHYPSDGSHYEGLFYQFLSGPGGVAFARFCQLEFGAKSSRCELSAYTLDYLGP